MSSKVRRGPAWRPCLPCRVEQEIAFGLSLYFKCNFTRDGVGRRACLLRHDGAVRTEQTIEERTLAHIRPSDDRWPGSSSRVRF